MEDWSNGEHRLDPIDWGFIVILIVTAVVCIIAFA